MIRFLKRAEIDEKKWNECVQNAVNSFPYGYIWYLDSVAERWGALVRNDYEMVFPLVWRRVLGKPFLYQPLFAQQLGIFSLAPPAEKILKEFLDSIPASFRHVDINLNYMNHVQHPDFEITPRNNFQLELGQDYADIEKGFSENTRRNIRKAQKAGLNIQKNIEPEKLITFLKTHVADALPEVKPFHYNAIRQIISKAILNRMGEAIGVFDNESRLMATGFFLFGKSRIINLFPANSPEGKKSGAGFLLLDHVIRSNAGRDIILDFEGSMIESIARFYKGFGAVEVNYWRLYRNNLPWYFKIFKK